MYDYLIEESFENPYYSTYKIKKGDSLYKISKEFNVNTKLLAELNGLKLDDYIYPDEIIYIPKKDVSYYITKEGDTLETVSNIFENSQNEIVEQNQTIYLQPGQMIYYKK